MAPSFSRRDETAETTSGYANHLTICDGIAYQTNTTDSQVDLTNLTNMALFELEHNIVSPPVDRRLTAVSRPLHRRSPHIHQPTQQVDMLHVPTPISTTYSHINP